MCPSTETGRPDSDGASSHAGLNITTMCLDRWQTDEMKDQPAVIWEGEEGGRGVLYLCRTTDIR